MALSAICMSQLSLQLAIGFIVDCLLPVEREGLNSANSLDCRRLSRVTQKTVSMDLYTCPIHATWICGFVSMLG